MVEEWVVAAVLGAERRLLDPAVRTNNISVENLLDPAFVEIGQSGRLWSREAMICALREPRMSSGLGHAKLAAVHVEGVGPDLYLLTYVLELQAGSTRRSSIWRLDGQGPRIVFHRGTRIDSP
ncbi:DUF4440 domain-containing protein [Cryobacterium sp. Y57]|uniref:nuclear transport factor 2 family protein n=1 Tax=Cryobacterium sp. Y57 TaxID=2048287 RepID=UPI000CE51728